MSLEDLTWKLFQDTKCSALNSEGRPYRLPHDFTDPYRRLSWRGLWYIIWWPVITRYRQCIRCKRVVKVSRALTSPHEDRRVWGPGATGK